MSSLLPGRVSMASSERSHSNSKERHTIQNRGKLEHLWLWTQRRGYGGDGITRQEHPAGYAGCCEKWVRNCKKSLRDSFLVEDGERRVLMPNSTETCIAFTENKRPRGLDDLLGHLLVKRIPVTYQLSSTKIPKYFHGKSKVDTRLSKTGNALNDPKLNLNT